MEAFCSIADQFPDAHLLLAGPVSDDYLGHAWARAVRARAKADPRAGLRIHFLGQVEDIPQLLAASLCLAAPLLNEPSPNVVMEAKAAGRPAVGFARGGVPELIQHGVDGLLCSAPTAPALADALATYLQDEGLAAAHGAAALLSLKTLGIEDFDQRWIEGV